MSDLGIYRQSSSSEHSPLDEDVKSAAVKSSPALLVLMVFAASGVSSDHSQREKLFRHRSTIAWACSSSGLQAFVYGAGMAIDADGAYRAYHPNDRMGLDSIKHEVIPEIGGLWRLTQGLRKVSQ
jgi:hypothetical protein